MTLKFNGIYVVDQECKKTTEVLMSPVRKLPLAVAEDAVVCVP